MKMTIFDEYQILAESGLFDASYYIDTYGDIIGECGDPILEYIEIGASEKRNPNQSFDTEYYLQQCEAIGERPHNPLLHFIQRGIALGLKYQRDQDVYNSSNNNDDMLIDANSEAKDILLKIEHASLNANQNNKFWTIRGSGWCVARKQIREIKVSVGDISARAYFGEMRHDIGVLLAKYPKSDHFGFRFTLNGIPVSKQDTIELIINVKDSEETEYKYTHTVYPESTFGTHKKVSYHPDDGENKNSLHEQPSMQLQVDSVSVNDEGILQVVGWAVCFAPIVTVQIFVEDERIGAADYGKSREDVALARPTYPNSRNSGFIFSANVSAFRGEERVIRVRAIASTGISREVIFPCNMDINSASSVIPLDISPHVHCDRIQLTTNGTLTVNGWAVLQENISNIIVFLNNIEIGDAECHIFRPDVGNTFPHILHARNSGFQCHFDGLEIEEGEHLVVLRICAGENVHDTPLPVLASEAGYVDASGLEHESISSDSLRLNIDAPNVVAGCVETPIRNNLEVAGWALARRGVGSIDVLVDGEKISTTFPGIRRLDVMTNFPDWENSLISGFSAVLPHRTLPKGRHTVSVVLRDVDNHSISAEFYVDIEDSEEVVGPWSLKQSINITERHINMNVIANVSWQPKFYILIQSIQKNILDQDIIKTVESIFDQEYDNWKILFNEASSDSNACKAFFDMYGEHDLFKDKIAFNADINSILDCESSLDQASLFFIMLSPGDGLGVNALLEFAVSSALDRHADFLYADERCINPVSGVTEAWFKPAWSPDLLLSVNYLGRAWCARADLFRRTAAGEKTILLNGDYDLVLRLTENATHIRHIAEVLFHSSAGVVDDGLTQSAALNAAIVRRRISGDIVKGSAPGSFRLKRRSNSYGLVSIIIPTCAAQGFIKTCIKTLRNETSYKNFEIICIENIPESQQQWRKFVRAYADDVISTQEPFNWSRFNNLCVERSNGEILLFLNDDIEVIDPYWLDALLEHSQRPEVGAVGAQLLYPDGRVQHAGMFLAGTGIARHPFRFADADDPGYFGLALTQRNVIAVTGACLLTRRETFDTLGGFDETHDVVNNDLDYCLKVHRHGLYTVYTPHARLIHHELASRSEIGDDYDTAAFDSQWRSIFLRGDPFFHPRFSRDRDDYACEWEPVELRFAGQPFLDRERIRRILVVKLDHIGDCIITLPALRRLQQHFPQAKLFVLSSSASRSIWSLELCVAEVIEFNFFHARSGLGMVELSDEDWQALEDRLRPYRFDLAVDMRKHGETRQVLQHTGARYFAGFEQHGRFPWLDVAIEAAEDQPYFAKRQHMANELINLADAIAAACETDRHVVHHTPAPLPAIPDKELIFSKHVVCIHPSAGNEMRQWPLEYFALLIDMFREEDDVHIILIGGPDEAELAEAILDHLSSTEGVWSLIGKTKVSDLPALMSACVLFIGNNSGPHHLAAGLGVPTLGVHSGVVDAREWGPLGPTAAAITRSMSCSPCYASKMDECSRGLACLRGLMPGDVYRACQRLLVIGRARQRPAATPLSDPPTQHSRLSSLRTALRKIAINKHSD